MAQAQGNIADIIDVAERAGDQISCVATDESESIRRGSQIIVGVLVSVVLVVAIGWYFLSGDPPAQATGG